MIAHAEGAQAHDMYLHWETVIQPLLERLQPDVVVEIGSDEGHNTRNLLAFCQRARARLYAVDPLPKFDVDEWIREYPDTLVFHKTTSLEALPLIDRADIVLIDGDHNWHTVIHELRALESMAGDVPGRFPLVLLHDVGWPYGRRDLYYEPNRIPEPHRKPYKKGGLRPGREDLDRTGGLNAHLNNALKEGGPQNGVLTAVEDFVHETEIGLDFLVVPGIHDLGILYSAELRSRSAATSDFLDQLSGATPLRQVLQSVEALRVESVIDALDRKRNLNETAARLVREREQHNQALEEHERRSAETKIRLESIRQERDQVAALSKRLRAKLNGHEARLARLVKSRDERIESLEAAKAELSVDNQQLSRQLNALRRRRSVRVALQISSFFKPLFNVARARTRRDIDGAPHKASGALPPPQLGTTPPRALVQIPNQTNDRLARSDIGSADIIVCIHNAINDVRTCLDSIVETTSLVNHRLILVDDGSEKAVGRMLDQFAAQYPVTLIRNEKARGYTIAANQGIDVSENRYVVLLNSDTTVTPGWLERLIRCAESVPDAGVVGPYSNAASWQSIPILTNPDGTWHLNPLPHGVSPASAAAFVARWSPRLYPRVPVVNGFCYLITRRALDEVGRLDEARFPRGYGEEDDFSIRCAEAGLKLYVADDSYVHHAKSRSHTPEGRRSMVVDSKKALQQKHGADTIRRLVDQIRFSEDLVRSRTFVGAAMSNEDRTATNKDFRHLAPRIGWLQPHLEIAGGIRRAVEMTNRLAEWGCHTTLITPDGWKTDWLPILSEVASIQDARSMHFDILIVSDPDMVWPFLELRADRKIKYHLAPYMLYRARNSTLDAFYEVSDLQIGHIANSKWTAERVQEFAGIGVEAIFPGGVDKRLFHPMQIERSHDVVCHGSQREHKGTITIERASSDMTLLKIEDRQADQHQMALLINSGKVYVSASWHEGFNLSALEAMACGIPVVMTDDGGSREYAVDQENALVVEPKDPGALRLQILRLREDGELRARLIENGLRTAWGYDWDKVSAQFADFLLDHDQFA